MNSGNVQQATIKRHSGLPHATWGILETVCKYVSG